MADENASVAYWQNQINEITAELTEMTGAGSISVGSFNVDQKAAYDQLMKQKAHAEHMIARLGSAEAQHANVIVTAEDGMSY